MSPEEMAILARRARPVPDFASIIQATRPKDGPDIPAVSGWQGPQFMSMPVPESGGANDSLAALAGLGTQRLMGLMAKKMPAETFSTARESAKAQGLGVMKGPVPEGFGGQTIVTTPRLSIGGSEPPNISVPFGKLGRRLGF